VINSVDFSPILVMSTFNNAQNVIKINAKRVSPPKINVLNAKIINLRQLMAIARQVKVVAI